MSGYNPIEDADRAARQSPDNGTYAIFRRQLQANIDFVKAITSELQNNGFFKGCEQLRVNKGVMISAYMRPDNPLRQWSNQIHDRYINTQIARVLNDRDTADNIAQSGLFMHPDGIWNYDRRFEYFLFDFEWIVGKKPDEHDPPHSEEYYVSGFTQITHGFQIKIDKQWKLEVINATGSISFDRNQWVGNRSLLGTQMGFSFEHPIIGQRHIDGYGYSGPTPGLNF